MRAIGPHIDRVVKAAAAEVPSICGPVARISGSQGGGGGGGPLEMRATGPHIDRVVRAAAAEVPGGARIWTSRAARRSSRVHTLVSRVIRVVQVLRVVRVVRVGSVDEGQQLKPQSRTEPRDIPSPEQPTVCVCQSR